MSARSDLVPHGTARGYLRHRCRCAECRAAETQRQREWRQRHRAGKVKHRGALPSCVPVRIRGVDYPSISVAAAALGVGPASISGMLRMRGHADGAGLGANAPRPLTLHRSKPIEIHGRVFPSISAAVRYLSVGRSQMNRMLRDGMTPRYLDYLLGKLMAADARAAALQTKSFERKGSEHDASF